jgi:hypothetical protein
LPAQGKEEALRAERAAFVSNDRADQAARALAPYIENTGYTDLESALRNFLVDFLHLTIQKSDAKFTPEKLREIVNQAVELHSVEPRAGHPPGGGSESLRL